MKKSIFRLLLAFVTLVVAAGMVIPAAAKGPGGDKHDRHDKHCQVYEFRHDDRHHQHHECPPEPAPSAPFSGASIPYLILYTSTELQNGYGLIVSTEPWASVENIMAAFKLTAIPADLKNVCAGPVIQMSPDDVQGNWVCDNFLIGILPYGKNGGRLPLLGTPSLTNINNVLIGAVPWVQP